MEVKVGLFVLLALLVAAYLTLKVSEKGLFSGGAYTVYALLDSAQGLSPKTPIEIAGLEVGALGEGALVDNRRARVELSIHKGVKLTKDVVAQVRTKGFLGQTYVDLIQGNPEAGYLESGDTIEASNPFMDIAQLGDKLNAIADSVHTIFADEEKAPVRKIFSNLESFTTDLKDFSNQNREDLNRVVVNLAALTEQLAIMVRDNRGELTSSMEHIESIARKIDEGRGTIGRLINDESTIDNLNRAVENLNDTLGGFSSFQLEMGYHLEYLGNSKDFKNYVEVGLRTRPDSAFLLEFVSDPNPSSTREATTTDITTGGTTTTVTTEREVTKRDKFRISAQMSRRFHNLRLRGGIIESSAGIGFDWTQKFFTASFSAFDFRTQGSNRPHLKAWGTINLTKNFFVMGGIDDPLNPNQATDWFFGGGVRFVDEDIKSLLGLGASAAR